MIPKKAGAIKLTVFPPDPKAVYIINKPGALNTL